MQRGSHSLKGGASFLLDRVDITFPGALQGVYTFQSLANFQAGRYATFQQAFGEAGQFQSNPNVGFFAQDEWKPRNDLTVNLGLRYDAQFLPDPIETDANNFAPRAGVAYSPDFLGRDRRTVLRASYGVFFDRLPLRATSNALQRDGSKYRVAVLPFGAAGAPVFPSTLEAFPEGLLVSVTTIDPRIRSAYSQQASLQVERELSGAMSLSVGYLHSRGEHIIVSRNVNVPRFPASAGVPNLGRPDPRFANVSRYESSGDSYYDGMVVSFKRRFGRRAQARVSYTFSKAIDDVGNAFFFTPQDNANLRDERGPADNDQRHRLALSGSFDAPRAEGGASLWRKTLDGFQLSYIFQYASPLPFNVLTGNDRNGDTNVNDRPAGVGRNTGRGFDSASLDLRLSRRWRLSERTGFEVIAEGFNVLNRANLQLPNNVFGAGATPLRELWVADRRRQPAPDTVRPAPRLLNRASDRNFRLNAMMKTKLFESLFRTPARVMCAAAALTLVVAGCEFATVPTPAPDAPATATAEVAAADARRVRVSAEGVNAAEPSVAAADGGAVYVAWVGHGAGKEADVWLARFDAKGKRESEPARVNPSAGDATAWRGDPPDVEVAPDGTVYVAWTARAGEAGHATTLYLSASRDGGRSFAPPVKVNDDARVGVHGMHSLAVGRDGRVYLAWLDERNLHQHHAPKSGDSADAKKASGGMHGEQNREVFFAASDDGGRTFSQNRRVASEACPCCQTALAVSGEGRVYVGWRQVLPGDFRHIAVAASEDGGETFAAPTVVSDDRWEIRACPVSGPALAAGEGGSLRVLWFTAGAAGQPGLYSSESKDGGRTFSPRSVLKEGNLRGTPMLLRDERGELVAVFEGANESGSNGLWQVRLGGATGDAPPASPVAGGDSASATVRDGRLNVAYVAQGGVWLASPDGGE